MNTNGVSADINHYGVFVDKNKVKCNYCDKLVCHSQRLKSHLAGLGGDVAPCEEVPLDVKEFFTNELLEKGKIHLRREVRSLDYSNLSFGKRRKCRLQSNDIEIETIDIQDVRHGEQEQKHITSLPAALQTVPRSIAKPAAAVECRESQPPIDMDQRVIASFFYESGLDICPANISRVQKVIDSILGSEQMDNNTTMPSSSLLKGKFLEDQVKQIPEYVNKIRDSWMNTGCSILLDGWFDENGRNLVNILVECPKGPIYLRSADISDDNVFEIFLDEVIADIGVENVIQIITYSVSPNMKVVGEKMIEKYPNIFWTVSASHCIELMLEKMQSIDMIKNVLIKAKTVTKFIDNCAEVVELMRTHTRAHNLVKSSSHKFAGCFLTLENIVSEEENLKRMVKSSEWTTSSWASSIEGKEVARLVADQSFWEDAGIVSRGTIPVVRVLELTNQKDKIMVGTIYETMDQVKETIKEELNGRESQYMQLWSIIDEIWDDCLHSPLHAAGYYLNPILFYSTDFFSDVEVISGLMCCLVRMKQSLHYTISTQLIEYQNSKGSFGEGSSSDRLTNILPAEWWSTYGGQCPELQKLAVRILSQTCNIASNYQLNRTFAEKMLISGKSCQEQKRLFDLMFVLYNIHLQLGISGMGNSNILG